MLESSSEDMLVVREDPLGRSPKRPRGSSSGQNRPRLPFWRVIWDDFVPVCPSGRANCDGRPRLPFSEGQTRPILLEGGKQFLSQGGQYGPILVEGGEVVLDDSLLDLSRVDLVFFTVILDLFRQTGLLT